VINIVHFSSAPGGIEILLQNVIRAFTPGTFRIFVIRPPQPGEENVYTNSDVEIVYGNDANIKAFFSLRKYSRKHRNEIFHVFNIGPFFLLAIRLAGVKKLVYSIRGTIYWKSGAQKIIRRFFWNAALSRRYRIIANSEHSRKMFTCSVKSLKQHVDILYNPAASDKFDREIKKDKPDSVFEVIYSGRLAEGKNLFRWLEIAKSIHDLNPGTRFILYGDGPLKMKLKSYTEVLGIQGCVEFRGFTTDMASAYSHADLFIFISEYESFGNVVVECILSGTPVIASDIPSMREIFTNFPQVMVPVEGDITGHILEKISRIDELNKLIPSMAEEFRSRFSASDHISKLKKIYESFG
jgi:glycosyltransferase involved in cell wall biosynthesis